MRQGQGQGIGWGKRSLLWCKTFQRDWTEGACDKKYSWCKAAYWYPTRNWGIFQLSCWLAHLWEGNNKHSLPTLDSSLTWDYIVSFSRGITSLCLLSASLTGMFLAVPRLVYHQLNFAATFLSGRGDLLLSFFIGVLFWEHYTSGLSIGSLFLLEFENTYKEGLKFCWWTAWTSQEDASWISRKIRVFGRGNDTSGLHSE